MKFPYGVFDFMEIVTQNYFYCDRTLFRTLEDTGRCYSSARVGSVKACCCPCWRIISVGYKHPFAMYTYSIDIVQF